MVDLIIVLVALIMVIVIISILMSGIRIIKPYEQGLLIVLGCSRRVLNPGMNWVAPFISTVVKMDLRTQVHEVPRQEVLTKDDVPTHVDAIIYYRVTDPKRAYFEITDYRIAVLALSQTTLRTRMAEMLLDDVLFKRHEVNTIMRTELDNAVGMWGLKVENFEVREVEPVLKIRKGSKSMVQHLDRLHKDLGILEDKCKKMKVLVNEHIERSKEPKEKGSETIE